MVLVDMEKVTDKKQFVFIVGAPRSGTTWLQSIFAMHPDVSALDFELRHFSSYIKPLLNSWKNEITNNTKGGWRQGLPLIWEEKKFHQFLKDFTDTVYAEVAKINPEATHIVDKHPGYSLSIDEIKLLIPNAKIIHIIRDPREVISSMLSARNRLGFGAEDTLKAIHHWKSFVDASRNSGKKYPEDFLEIKYELLKARPSDFIGKIFQFCGLPTNDDLILKISEKSSFENLKASKPDLTLAHLREKGIPLWEAQLDFKDKIKIHNLLAKDMFDNQYITSMNKDWYIHSFADRIRDSFYRLINR